MKFLRGELKQLSAIEEDAHLCNVAAAIVGAAVVGGVVSSDSSRHAANSASDANSAAVSAQSGVAEKQLEQSKYEFEENKKRAAALDALTEKVTNSQLETQAKQNALADDYNEYNQTVFRPLEKGIVSDAENYDTPLRQEIEAGKASASVAQQLDAARSSSARELARMGINPNSGRYAGERGRMDVGGAIAGAAAANDARTKVETLGAAKRMDAASLGRNLPSAQATSAGLALTAGTNAVNNGATANGSYVAGQQPGVSLLNGAGTTFGSTAANSAAMYGAANARTNSIQSGIGSAAGMLLRYNQSGGGFTANSGGASTSMGDSGGVSDADFWM